MSNGKNTRSVPRTRKQINTMIKCQKNHLPTTHSLPLKPQSEFGHIFARRPCRDKIDDFIQRLENASETRDSASSSTASSSTALRPKPSKMPKRKRMVPLPLPITSYKALIPTKALKPGPPKLIQETQSASPGAQKLRHFLEDLKNVQCHRSPFTPQTIEDIQVQNKWFYDRIGMIMQARSEADALQACCPRITTPCMAGKIFATNHSAVLSSKTMWCPLAWPDAQGAVAWPPDEEFKTEGWDRYKNGYGRFFPLPRTEAFEERLATPQWRANPMMKYPEWNGWGIVPVKERRFAVARGWVDRIVDLGRVVDEEFIFDRAVEWAKGEEWELVGRDLWRMLEGGGEEEDVGRRKRVEEKVVSWEKWGV